ncbi:MAG: IS701 family transposase [Actinomycetota bacterium]|nr:IS701 family transposase [Actinomycetota bacterium]
MTKRLPADPAPGPLEEYAARFDDLFDTLAGRQAFRRYLEGLLLPAERNKTLTALANTEPAVGAQRREAQGLQWFLSESTWDPEEVNRRRVRIVLEDPRSAPTAGGALVVDETGDRKDGKATAHVGKQYLGGIGKIDDGVVSVSSLWVDERIYYPLEVEPYTPAHHFEGGKADPEFRTKPRMALELVERAVEAGLPFRAVVGDILYGEHRKFKEGLENRGIPYVLSLKPSHAWWHPVEEVGWVEGVAQAAHWNGPGDPGEWVELERRFRDGHTEVWWALEAECRAFGTENDSRLVVATTDPATLPRLTSWYLATNLPAVGSSRAEESRLEPADPAEIVGLYALRDWVEQSYKQVKNALGWAHYQVRKDISIRRHWQMVCLAFTFCWWESSDFLEGEASPGVILEEKKPASSSGIQAAEGGKKERRSTQNSMPHVAARAAKGEGVARTVRNAHALLEGVLGSAPAAGAESAA